MEHLLLFSVFQRIPSFYFSVLNYEYALVFIRARKILQVKEKNKKKEENMRLKKYMVQFLSSLCLLIQLYKGLMPHRDHNKDV